MQEARNCEGKYADVPIKVLSEIYNKCPISALSTNACELLNIVEACEGEFGGQRSPSDFLDETAYYHNVRTIILHEKWRVEQDKEKHKKELNK
jgi:hypothetical protein